MAGMQVRLSKVNGMMAPYALSVVIVALPHIDVFPVSRFLALDRASPDRTRGLAQARQSKINWPEVSAIFEHGMDLWLVDALSY